MVKNIKPRLTSLKIIATITLLVFNSGYALAVEPVNVGDGFVSETIGPHAEIFIDKSGSLVIEQVVIERSTVVFAPADAKRLNLGYTRDPVWMRFYINNSTANEMILILEFAQTWVDHADLYIIEPDGYRVIRNGDFVTYSERELKHRYPLYRIVARPGQSAYYMRFTTTSSLSLNLKLWTPDALSDKNSRELPFLWLMYGILFAMLMYNSFVYLSVGDRSYLFYLLFIGPLLLYIMTLNGSGYMYLWPESPQWASRALSFFANMAAVGFFFFSRSYLDLKTYLPVWDKIILGITMMPFIVAIITLVSPPGYTDGLALYTAVIGITLVMILTLAILKKGQREARLYLVGWSFIFIGVFMQVLRVLGVLQENILTFYSFQIGAILQVIFYSYGLADRMQGIARERVRALEDAHRIQDRYRKLVENSSEAIFVTQDLKIVYINPRSREYSGYSDEEIMAGSFDSFIHPEDRATMTERFRRRIAGENVQNQHNFRIIRKDGGIRWMEISAVVIEWEGRPALLNFMQDITERKQTEEFIQASLREKEVLLKEIHHRVKNNMQIVSSLLNLQMSHITDEAQRSVFLDSQNRIRSMALIHEKMYQSSSLASVDFSDYIRNLVSYLYRTYNVNPSHIVFEVNTNNAFLGIDVAIPCGLMINELVSNSIKHGFPGGRSGRIAVSLSRQRQEGSAGDEYILTVEDNGIGMEGAAGGKMKTLGLELVSTMVAQMHGKLVTRNEGGACFKISFPVQE